MSSILSVSQLNKYVAFKLKSDVKLKGVCVKGEISNFSVNYKSGHAYFTVKDAQSTVKAVMFSVNVGRLKSLPSDGDNVLVTGNVEVYEAGGIYQIIATDITPLGIGLINTQIELVKEKLIKQGVFDESQKKPIPVFPRKIAVVSSLTGAALQDIINIIQRRFPVCTVGIYHTMVQGEKAAESIAQTLALADSGDYDTLILARGGGSLEDLMPFNTEIVAVAIHNCKTPVISAVGHETDTTLSDYAADLRAPTPSAAAELATPDRREMVAAVDKLKQNLNNALVSRLDRYWAALDKTVTQLSLCSPDKMLERDEQKLSVIDLRLNSSMDNLIQRLDHALDKNAGSLNALSPFGVLTRGYSIVSKGSSVLTNADEINENDMITVRFAHSSVCAVVNNITRKEETI